MHAPIHTSMYACVHTHRKRFILIFNPLRSSLQRSCFNSFSAGKLAFLMFKPKVVVVWDSIPRNVCGYPWPVRPLVLLINGINSVSSYVGSCFHFCFDCRVILIPTKSFVFDSSTVMYVANAAVENGVGARHFEETVLDSLSNI